MSKSKSLLTNFLEKKTSKPQPPLQGTASEKRDGNEVGQGEEDPCIV